MRRMGRLRDRLVGRLLGVGRADLRQLGAHLEGQANEIAAERAARIRLQEDHATLAADLKRTADDLGRLWEYADGATREVASARIEFAAVGQEVASLADRLRLAELHASIAPTMLWVESAEVAEDTLVSVILPTRDRPDRLARAIRSVLAQSYPTWELIVIDDGSGDDVGSVVRADGDPRIRLERTGGAGVGTARNRGLEVARGRLIAYLDDDNTMHPGWLKAVVWALGERPEFDVLYGARAVDDPHVAQARRHGQSGAIHLEPFDRRRLEQGNYIDLGTVAHRSGLDEARFDPELPALGDWDLLLRLTRDAPPLTLPAIAVVYRRDAPRRISDRVEKWPVFDRVRSRAAIPSPRPRILAVESIFPLHSETYIGEEIETLARYGAAVAYCRNDPPWVEPAAGRPVFEDLEEAVRAFDPHLFFVHWIPFAERQLPRIEALGVPFAVRVHSFDFDPDAARRLAAHELCVGVWAYPAHARRIGDAYELPPILGVTHSLPEPSAERDLVLSVSAGLPKKDWDTMLVALGQLAGLDRRIVVATTNDFEALPARLAERLREIPEPPRLMVNVPRDEVFGMLSRAAVLLYTLEEGVTFGNPMSVAEGLCAGAAIVLPDRPDAIQFAGPNARGYRTAEDIGAHVRAVVAGGPEIEAEHRANRRFGLERFTDERVQKRFSTEVIEALERWRETRGYSSVTRT